MIIGSTATQGLFAVLLTDRTSTVLSCCTDPEELEELGWPSRPAGARGRLLSAGGQGGSSSGETALRGTLGSQVVLNGETSYGAPLDPEELGRAGGRMLLVWRGGG